MWSPGWLRSVESAIEGGSYSVATWQEGQAQRELLIGQRAVSKSSKRSELAQAYHQIQKVAGH